MRIRLDTFSGIAPGVAPAKLPPGMAQVATNCDFSNGDLRPLRGLTTIIDLGDTTLKSLYYFDGVYRAWNQDVDVARSPIGNNTGRTLAFGVSADGPEEWDETSAVAGLSPTGYLLGIPAPTVAPTLTAGSGGGCDSADQTSVSIQNTFLRRWSGVDEEGPPSDAAIIDLCEGQAVTIGSFAAVPTGDYNITHRRIYGAFAGTYLFITELPVATTSYDFTFSVDGFGSDTLLSQGWDPPPTNALGLVIKSNGVGVAFDGNEVVISEPYQLHAWPVEYRLSTDYPVTALITIGDSVAVLTQGSQYLLLGSDPASMELKKLESYQTCPSKLSAVDMGEYGIYAGTDGLIAISPSGETRNLTEAWYTPDLWRTLIYPASVRAYNWRGSYVAFYFQVTGYTQMTVEDSMESLFDAYTGTPGGFIYDRKYTGLRLVDFAADGGRAILEDVTNGGVTTIQAGLLALLFDGVVKEFADNDAAYLTADWKSGIFRSSKAINIGAAQVIADAYPCTFKVYATLPSKGSWNAATNTPTLANGTGAAFEAYQVSVGGTVDFGAGNVTFTAGDYVIANASVVWGQSTMLAYNTHTKTVTDANPFRLPGGYRALDWEFEILTSSGAVRYAVVAETLRELSLE